MHVSISFLAYLRAGGKKAVYTLVNEIFINNFKATRLRQKFLFLNLVPGTGKAVKVIIHNCFFSFIKSDLKGFIIELEVAKGLSPKRIIDKLAADFFK